MPPDPQRGKGKGGAPIVPIVIAAIAVIAIVLVVVFVVKPGEQPAGSSNSASPAASASSASAVDKFYGDWKLAAMEAAGVTMAGDIHSLIGIDDAAVTISADGTGKISAAGENATFTWRQQDKNTLALTFDSAEQAKAFGGELKLTYDNGTLSFSMNSAGVTGKVFLSKDGTMEGVRQISMDNAGKVPSEENLIGTWNFSGMSMEGASIYGDVDQLASFMPTSLPSTSATFAKDGTATFMGISGTWKVNSKDNTVITIDDDKYTVKWLDGDIVINLGQPTEDTADDVVMMFSKAS